VPDQQPTRCVISGEFSGTGAGGDVPALYLPDFWPAASVGATRRLLVFLISPPTAQAPPPHQEQDSNLVTLPRLALLWKLVRRRSSSTRIKIRYTNAQFSGATIHIYAVDILLIILAIFLPPVSVFLKRGCDIHLLVSYRLRKCTSCGGD
jgi:hypothetical protein